MGSKRTMTPRQRCPTRLTPLDVVGSESVAADLPPQVRRRDGVTCPRYRSNRTVRNNTTERFSGISEGLRSHEPLEDDDVFVREYVVHADGEYVDDEVHVNTCESHALPVRRKLSTYRESPQHQLTQYSKLLPRRRIRLPTLTDLITSSHHICLVEQHINGFPDTLLSRQKIHKRQCGNNNMVEEFAVTGPNPSWKITGTLMILLTLYIARQAYKRTRNNIE